MFQADITGHYKSNQEYAHGCPWCACLTIVGRPVLINEHLSYHDDL